MFSPSALDVLGFAAAAVSACISVPQLMKTIGMYRRGESITGVSVGTLSLTLLNAVLWVVWAVWAKAYPAGVASLVNGPAVVLTLILLRRSKEAAESAPEAPQHPQQGCGCGWPDGSAHVISVTAPPGAGSKVRCGGSPHPYGVPVPA